MNPRELAERVLELAAGRGEAEVVVQRERSGLARFAASEVHQPTLVDDTVVQLRLVRDGRVGTAGSNRIEADGLAALVERAEAVVASATPDPEFAGLPGPAPLPEVAGFDEATALLAPDDLARLAAGAIEAAGLLSAYGYVTSGACELAVASSTGLRAAQRFTDAAAITIAAADGRSGYAAQSASAVAAIDPAAVAREAAATAELTRAAGALEPGTYRAVLGPYAVAELLHWFALDTFNGLAFVEERGYLAGRLGEQVFDPGISIWDDALDTRGLPKAFDFEGTPKQRVALVEAGVARGVVWDRAAAARAGGTVRSTGHAGSPADRSFGPLPLALSVAPGEAESTDELAALVGDGIHVTRLHYLGIVDPREGILTGMTRDGTFRIRNGARAEPLVNLRFTVRVPEVLAEVPGLTRELTLVNLSDFYAERYAFGALVPGLATARFAVTGSGSGPGL
ncbi:MAG: TldD/PmbA family protein [Gaiellaceae bacterium]